VSVDSSVYENAPTSYSGEASPHCTAQHITLLDQSRKPAIVWEFLEAWPCNWTRPAINDEKSAIVIDEMVLVLAADFPVEVS